MWEGAGEFVLIKVVEKKRGGSFRSGAVVKPVVPWFMHGVVSGGGRRPVGRTGKSTYVQYFTILVKG